ncbi:IS1/IS1595 family N-terminal zinc-binding domain-containing protein [Alysiella crassa]
MSSLPSTQYNIKKKGFSGNQKQRYACKDCKSRFMDNHNLT